MTRQTGQTRGQGDGIDATLSSMSFLVSLSRSIGIAACAVMCGAVASRALFTNANWLSVAPSLVLAGACVVVWHVVAEVAWAIPAATWRGWAFGQPMPALPYAQPGSDASHLSTNLGQFGAWVQQAFAPRYAGTVLIGIAGVLVAFVVAALLGPQAAVLVILAIGLPQLAVVICRGSGQPDALLRAFAIVSLPMMLGYASVAPLGIHSVCVALVFGAVAAAANATENNSLLRHVGFGLGLAVTVVLRQPFGAFVLAVLWLMHWFAPPAPGSSNRATVWLLASMAATSVALAL